MPSLGNSIVFHSADPTLSSVGRALPAGGPAAISLPPALRYAKAVSTSGAPRPTARASTMSNPRCNSSTSDTIVSALPWYTAMSGRASSRRSAWRKETGFRRDSISVRDSPGSTTRRGTPGMPAPAPMSRTRTGLRGRRSVKSSESRKSPRPMSARVRSDVR